MSWGRRDEPGQAIGDLALRGGIVDVHLEILRSDGTPLGSIMTSGFTGGAAPPGLPSGLSFNLARETPLPVQDEARWPRIWGGINLGAEPTALVFINLLANDLVTEGGRCQSDRKMQRCSSSSEEQLFPLWFKSDPAAAIPLFNNDASNGHYVFHEHQCSKRLARTLFPKAVINGTN